MTFTKMLDETHLKYFEGEFRADMRAPYIVWGKDCETVCADSVVVDISGEYIIYLFTSRGDNTSEAALESVLNAHKVAYTKDQSWIGGTQKVWLSEYHFAAQLEW